MSSEKLSESRRESTDLNHGGRRKSLMDTILSSNNFKFFGSTENISLIRRHIHLMDDRCINIEFTAKTRGRNLLKTVCRHLRVMDSIIYFGIRYRDNDDVEQWLELDGRVLKQIKDLRHHTLSLRVMFYPPDPLNEFKEPESKHLFYLQLRRDFHMGRLRTDPEEAYELAALAIQADHSLQSIPDGFDIINIPGGLRILPNLSPEVISKIRAKLESILWMSSEEAKNQFISKASKVETYGMQPFQVMDQLGTGLCIGFNYMGISAFKNGQRTNVFPWRIITSVRRVGKQLVIVIPRGKREVNLGFKCQTTSEASLLWRRATDCKHFSREAIEKVIYPDDRWVDTGNFVEQLNHETSEPKNPGPKLQLESQSSSSHSSTEELRSISSHRERPFEASQHSVNQFLPIPRHSLAVPRRKPLVLPRNSLAVPRNSFGGSMNLRSRSMDAEPHIIESYPDNTEPLYLITRSSINLANE